MAGAFAGKVALVTGGGAGIGRASASAFTEAGASVVVADIDRVGGEQTVAAIAAAGGAARFVAADVSREDHVAAMVAAAVRELGRLDVLVNNAGVPKRRSVLTLDAATVEAVNRINYLSPIRLTLALLPALIESSGEIVNISSVAARLSPPAESAYAATKAAITAFSESMAVDLRDTEVGVHVVNPGVIDTELFHLPDNDEGFHSAVEALPVEAIVDPVVEQLDAGTFEIYVPAWFHDVTAGKFANPQGFIEGTKEYARSLSA